MANAFSTPSRHSQGEHMTSLMVGKAGLVTGAAGGIGRATALVLAERVPRSW